MKKVLITGASEGIGREFAKTLARQNYSVHAIARNEKRLQELIQEIGNPQVHSYSVADLSEKQSTAQIEKIILSQKFDLLINNAGFGVYGEFATSELASLHSMMEVNCNSLLALSKAFLKTATSGDSLINVSSMASLGYMPFASAYAATKAFVTSLSENLWYEEKEKGVYVMALCPGVTMTQFHTRAGGQDLQVPSWSAQTPQQVVDIALRALKRRSQPVVTCGPARPFIFFSKFVPRKLVIYISGKVLEKFIEKG